MIMNARARCDLMVMVAGVLGLATGQMILDRLATEVGADEPSAVDMRRLASAMTLAGRIGRIARLERAAVGQRSALAFLAGASTVAAMPALRHLAGSRRAQLRSGVQPSEPEA
jgi:hypothetical protein